MQENLEILVAVCEASGDGAVIRALNEAYADGATGADLIEAAIDYLPQP
jgi:hypothetical protein